MFQYNYSHQNEGGFMLICAPGKAVNEDTIIRYNISVHDGINSARVFHFGGGATRTHVYNNTIVLAPHQNLPMLLFTEWNKGGRRIRAFPTISSSWKRAGGRPMISAPARAMCLKTTSSAGVTRGCPPRLNISPAPRLAGFVKPAPGLDPLQALRPADVKTFPRGILIKNNGGRDFFGNPLPFGQPPMVGAFEK